MIVPDLKLLLCAHNRSVPQHPPARGWSSGLMDGGQDIGVPEPVLFGLLRIATQRGILASPLATDKALAIVRSWIAWPRLRVLYGTAGSPTRALAPAEALGVAGRLTTDIQIAALTMEYRSTLHRTDTDFARMPGLRWSNPL